MGENSIIIYNTEDGQASVSLYAQDGSVWMNQNQLAELFATSKPNISMHTSNIVNSSELEGSLVVKKYLTTAADEMKKQSLAFQRKMEMTIYYDTHRIINQLWRKKPSVQKSLQLNPPR